MTFDAGIEGKTAFVTGGASGIGETLCRSLASLGAKVAIADRILEQATRLAEELSDAGAQAIPVDLDVADASSVLAAIDRTVGRFGRLDFAVNNAGIVTPRGAVDAQSPEDWNLCLSVNLTGVFYCMRAEVPAMLASGGGSIVNVSSICGLVAVAGTAAYTAAKHGVVGLTKTAALDYATQGIRVNAVAPGYVDTPLIATRPDEERQSIMARHPVERMATPQEIANLAIFLLSNRAGFITGSVHLADGGYTAR